MYVEGDRQKGAVMSSPRSSNTGWSPERSLWDELESLGRDLSWKKVALEQNRGHLLPDGQRGGYLIGASPPAPSLNAVNAYTILHAGQVKSPRRGLRGRLLEHVRRPTAKLEVFVECHYPMVHFWHAIMNNASRIGTLKILLMETFRPLCNSIRAPGTQASLADIGKGGTIATGRRPRPNQE